jgi:protein-S-isoprenylcysteine O-methyltransferase Ste14
MKSMFRHDVMQQLLQLLLTSIEKEKVNLYQQLLLLLPLTFILITSCLSSLEETWPPLHVVTHHVVLLIVVFILYWGWMYMTRNQAMLAAYNRVALNLKSSKT